jgi:hypothetical protein
MAIAVVMAALIVVISSESLKLWDRVQGASATSTQAALAMDQLQRDLEAAMIRNDGKNWMSVVIESNQSELTQRGWLLSAQAVVKPVSLSTNLLPSTSPALIRDARFGQGGVWLRLVATDISSSGGRPVAVSYQINRRPVTGTATTTNLAEVRYLFLREELSPSATLTATSALFSNRSTPSTLVTSSLSDTLAINVVDFGIWLYERDAGNQLRLIFPTSATAPAEFSVPVNGTPVEADIMVRVLTDKGATTIAAMESGRIATPPEFQGDFAAWWWSVAEANSDVFVRRVQLFTSLP